MKFLVNDIIKNKSELNPVYERILWISPDYKVCRLIQLETNKLKIREEQTSILEQMIFDDQIELITKDFTHKIVLEENIDEKHKEARAKAYEIVSYIMKQEEEPYIYDRKVKGKLIREASKKFNLSHVVIYKYLRLFLQGARRKNSLLPKYFNCGQTDNRVVTNKLGRPPKELEGTGENKGIIIDNDIKSIFEMARDRYYRKPQEKSLTTVYFEMLHTFFSDIDENGLPNVWTDDKIPSLRQFRYWHELNKDPEKDTRTRTSDKNYESNHRGLRSNSTFESFGPGFRYQIDATVANIYLVSRIDRRSIIGKPVVYIAKDVFSRLIAGIHVGLEGPSWNGAASVIYNCSENKVEFCKRYDIDIVEEDWPAAGIPEVILGDRGELISTMAENAIKNLGIIFENAPSYRGDAKGVVERNFRTIKTTIKNWAPGAIKKEYRERGDRDYRLDAKLDIWQFTRMIIVEVIRKNKSILAKYPLNQEMVDMDIIPTPIELWNWGMQYRTGALRRLPDEVLRLNLMKRATASVTLRGIEFRGALFSAPIAEKENWYSRARSKGVRYVPIVYDDRDLSTIYIIDEKSNKFIQCYMKEENIIYINRTFEEIEDFNYLKTIKHRSYINEQNQNEILAIHKQKEIVNKAQSMAVKASESNAKRVRNIRVNRKQENEELRKMQALTFNKAKKHVYQEVKKEEKDVLKSDKRALEFIKTKKGMNS